MSKKLHFLLLFLFSFSPITFSFFWNYKIENITVEVDGDKRLLKYFFEKMGDKKNITSVKDIFEFCSSLKFVEKCSVEYSLSKVSLKLTFPKVIGFIRGEDLSYGKILSVDGKRIDVDFFIEPFIVEVKNCPNFPSYYPQFLSLLSVSEIVCLNLSVELYTKDGRKIIIPKDELQKIKYVLNIVALNPKTIDLRGEDRVYISF